ncbi:uncharacterized protein N7443_009250 [Penicillium atrosanguineum]|uniref:uncharacterized protein n=1 Tax=Penicillium atrosanguineum TaxID=1132637 RepID=UPI0023A6D154|nr:uncharacterized protein N7443_009250 [Penicillium atrosanguineum]KAJ5293297.1 hypothetical protein N7443_009250 [Penicillium atrosanguineum]
MGSLVQKDFDDLFKIRVGTHTWCDRGHIDNTSIASNLHLRLAFPQNHDSATLQRAVNEHFEVKLLEECSRCKKLNYQSEFLENAPEVLQVQLNRIDLVGGKLIKIKDKIRFKETLRFKAKNFLPPLSNTPGEELHYGLSSVQIHNGESTDVGHYYIGVKTKDKTWTVVNDESLSRFDTFEDMMTDQLSRIQQQAYIFTYRRLPTNPALGEATVIRTAASTPSRVGSANHASISEYPRTPSPNLRRKPTVDVNQIFDMLGVADHESSKHGSVVVSRVSDDNDVNGDHGDDSNSNKHGDVIVRNAIDDKLGDNDSGAGKDKDKSRGKGTRTSIQSIRDKMPRGKGKNKGTKNSKPSSGAAKGEVPFTGGKGVKGSRVTKTTKPNPGVDPIELASSRRLVFNKYNMKEGESKKKEREMELENMIVEGEPWETEVRKRKPIEEGEEEDPMETD